MQEGEKNISSSERSGEDIEKVLSQVEGLETTLHQWCDVSSEEKGPLSFDQVVGHMLNNEEVKEAVKAYLSPGGIGYERDMDSANQTREALAWTMIEELEKRVAAGK